MEKVQIQWKTKITSVSGIDKTLIIIAVVYCYSDNKNGRVLK